MVTQSGREYEAETIILAAGYGSREIAQTIGIDIPMLHCYIEALVTEIQPPMFDIMIGTADADFYGHQSEHGSFVFGSSSGLEMYANKPDQNLRTTPLTLSAACRVIQSYIPQLKDAKIVRSWGGFSDVTADHVPVVSFVDEVPGADTGLRFLWTWIRDSTRHWISSVSDGSRREELYHPIDDLRYDRFKSAI